MQRVEQMPGNPEAKRVIPRTSLCLLLCSFLALPCSGQAPPAQGPATSAASQQPDGIRVNVDLVLVPVTVLDPRGIMVTGLERKHFRVFEDGVEQEVELLHVEEVPISVAIVFDISGSMKEMIGGARAAALEFLRNANREDAFVLVAFKDRAEVISHVNTSDEEVRDRLLTTTAKGNTALLDGIYLALAQLRRAPTRRRALLVLTDGMDNHSRYSVKDVEQALLEADVALYAIGTDDYGLLRKFAQSTGGRIFPLAWIEDTTTRIWAELRSQYLVGYRPSNRTADGKWRKIKVQIRKPRGLPKLYIFAKSGYYAPPM